MHVGEGEVVALLGANGAGKTTLIRTITGLLKPTRGQVIFQGQSITGLPAEKIAGRRIACVPEGRHIFPGLTVLDNLILGSVSRGRLPKAELEKDLEKIFESFPILRDFKIRLGWQLSGGQQQMLAIGRGLMAKPKMLLLDEPSLGLAPVLVQEVFRVIKKISQSGTTILLVEQNARMALSVADRGYVLSTGNIVLADTTPNLLANTEMQQHYLGGKRKKAHN
jgi:branched-chain amino acid transport system ATP-binding protein